jgi:hypothetical protein
MLTVEHLAVFYGDVQALASRLPILASKNIGRVCLRPW